MVYANDLSDKTKAKKLSTLLKGEAIAVWFDLMTEEQEMYSAVIMTIVKQMASTHFLSLTAALVSVCPRVKVTIGTGNTSC